MLNISADHEQAQPVPTQRGLQAGERPVVGNYETKAHLNITLIQASVIQYVWFITHMFPRKEHIN